MSDHAHFIKTCSVCKTVVAQCRCFSADKQKLEQVCDACLSGAGPKKAPELAIDNSFKADGKPMLRFYLERLNDATGVSRTGRVLEGVLCPDGKVITQWRSPHSTIGIYNSMDEFLTIHVKCHPSGNRVVWLDIE